MTTPIITQIAVARRSLLAVSLVAAFAAIEHSYTFGIAALFVGALVIVALVALMTWYQRAGGRIALVGFLSFALWLIIGFGVVGGLWNHGVKLLVLALHGAMPATLAPMFMAPEPEPAAYEVAGLAMGAAALFAAPSVIRLMLTANWRRST